MKQSPTLISVIIPLYNEAAGLRDFHANLHALLTTLNNYTFEIVYCDDGSTDKTPDILKELSVDKRIKIVRLSRNFGKENSLTAGIASATGHALLMLDGDGQHPIADIPLFLEAWDKEARVVIGIRETYEREDTFKRIGSRFFYRWFNRLSHTNLKPGSSDYRLIDRQVQQAFLRLPETDRVTRGLIDWLGFEREYVYYQAKPRISGSSAYSHRKLVGLATNSFVSMTSMPLYIFGYIGIFITSSAFTLGSIIIVQQLLLGDPLDWNITGTAMLSILLMFLVGIVLLSQGILALYISHINNQSKQRPLYIVDYEHSIGVSEDHRA